MPRILIVSTLFALLPAALWAAGSSEGGQISTQPVSAGIGGSLPGFAVVELFTSEGCSSCPPADEVLSSLIARSSSKGLPVYALAWHVDYWNYLGWQDPYSSVAASARQRAYAAALSSSLYTPQIIVGGREVAGYAGDRAAVDRLVQIALGQRARAGIVVGVRLDPGQRTVTVRTAVAGLPRTASVLVALVENGLTQHPDAGENAGRTLVQSAVVRSFALVKAGSGSSRLLLPSGLDPSKSRIVVLVQNGRAGEILGANETPTLDKVESTSADAEICGRVYDAEGSGLSGALVQACSDQLCIPAKSDQNGSFRLIQVPAGSYTMKLFAPGDTTKTRVSLPLVVDKGEHITLPAVTVGT
ncbi:MAG TPA: DUF1223 domain-containing protein [Spirochaetia bacterium]|nr:DUF1223 domain-containing protein [Spirochaetia bacterium]